MDTREYARNLSRSLFGKKFSGFTLAELIVVITVLAILATVGFLALSGYTQDAKNSAGKTNVRSVSTAISAESALTGNSPRFYVVHDSAAALTGAFVYAEGNQTALTGGSWDTPGTNYSAGNPDYVKLKLNPDKFKVSFLGKILSDALASSYNPKSITVGAVDYASSTSAMGRARVSSFHQVAMISSQDGSVAVTGNYPTSVSGSVVGLIKNPVGTGALVDGGKADTAGTCGTANKNYAFSATGFLSDTFCSEGVHNPASLSFPAAGSTVSWTCGAAACGASRSVAPVTQTWTTAGTYSWSVPVGYSSIEITLNGAGGGGGGRGDCRGGTTGNGTAGTVTTFNSTLIANAGGGGGGGMPDDGVGGAWGTSGTASGGDTNTSGGGSAGGGTSCGNCDGGGNGGSGGKVLKTYFPGSGLSVGQSVPIVVGSGGSGGIGVLGCYAGNGTSGSVTVKVNF